MPSVSDITRLNLPSVKDVRGILTSVESGIDIPFEIKRIFYMHHIISDRGGHAHTDTDQVVTAISGSFQIELFDGLNKIKFKMDDPSMGLYIPRMIFINLFDFSPGAVCLVLASTMYDMKKSIRNIEDYMTAIK
jgi:dTDP-4-dehydrorhamnose 3,5-epimerase-like enzyme